MRYALRVIGASILLVSAVAVLLSVTSSCELRVTAELTTHDGATWHVCCWRL